MDIDPGRKTGAAVRLLCDVVATVGIIMLGSGLWLIWPPLGLCFAGAVLVFVGLAGAFLCS